MAFVIGTFAVFNSSGSPSSGATTATGMLAENYLPFVMYNNGYNSAKDISTTADVYGADLFASDDLTVAGGSLSLTSSNTATSSATIGCINTYASSTGQTFHLAISSYATTTATFGQGTYGYPVVAIFGSCP